MVVAETPRLLLREFHIGDAKAMDSVFGDAEVMRFGWGVQPPEWVQAWVCGCLESYEQRGFGFWAVVERSTGEVIGYCGLSHLPDFDGRPEIEIGYRLARHSWGRGYGTEAAVAVRDHAFDKLSLPRLIALIDPRNVASIRVAEKIGMRYENDAMLAGYTHPDRVYAIARPSGA